MNKFIFLVLSLFSLAAVAEVSVEVVETFPAQTDQALAVDQSFYVHLKYSSDLPARIYVRPYVDGAQSNAISHGAVLLPPGSGETLGWFALRSPGTVDGYRVSVDTKNSGYPEDVLTVPVKLQWQPGGVMTNTGQPEWIGRINQINEALSRAERANVEMESSGFGTMLLGMVLMPLLFGIPLLALVLCVVAVIRWEGRWRYAGALPLVLLGIWLVNFIYDVTKDPTSHNLWPFELLYWAGFTFVWLVLWFVVKKGIGKREVTGS